MEQEEDEQEEKGSVSWAKYEEVYHIFGTFHESNGHIDKTLSVFHPYKVV